MEKRKDYFKIIMSIVFSIAILGAFVYVIWKGEIDASHPYLYYGTTCASFLLSLIFIRKCSKKILITLALALNVAADYFLVFDTSIANAQIIGMSIFCGVQFVYLVYSLTLSKGNGMRVLNVAVRVALCLGAYLILPMYFTFSWLELIAVFYGINFLISVIIFAIHMKTEWLLFVGYFLFFLCDISIGLVNGGIDMLGLAGTPFAEILMTYNFAFYFYVPGTLLISLSSVFAKKDK